MARIRTFRVWERIQTFGSKARAKGQEHRGAFSDCLTRCQECWEKANATAVLAAKHYPTSGADIQGSENRRFDDMIWIHWHAAVNACQPSLILFTSLRT